MRDTAQEICSELMDIVARLMKVVNTFKKREKQAAEQTIDRAFERVTMIYSAIELGMDACGKEAGQDG